MNLFRLPYGMIRTCHIKIRRVVFYTVCLLVFYFSSGLFPDSDSCSVGIYPIEAAGAVSASESAALDMILSSAVTEAGLRGNDYNVFDRKNLERILNEQELQESGCTSSDCIVKIGKLAKIDYALNTKIEKKDDHNMITFSMISINSAQVVTNFTRPFFHIDEAVSISKKFASGLPDFFKSVFTDKNRSLSKEKKGTSRDSGLIIKSVPGSALVEIPSLEPVLTPAFIPLEPDTYRFKVTYEGYRETNLIVLIKPNRTVSVNVRLEKKKYKTIYNYDRKMDLAKKSFWITSAGGMLYLAGVYLYALGERDIEDAMNPYRNPGATFSGGELKKKSGVVLKITGGTKTAAGVGVFIAAVAIPRKQIKYVMTPLPDGIRGQVFLKF